MEELDGSKLQYASEKILTRFLNVVDEKQMYLPTLDIHDVRKTLGTLRIVFAGSTMTDRQHVLHRKA